MPPRLHVLAGVAIAAAAVLHLDHDARVLLYVAAQLVRIVLVFDRQLDALRGVLVDLDKTVLFQSHERYVDGELDVVGSVELQLPMPSSQLSSSFALSNWLCLIVKAPVLTVYTSTPLSVSSLYKLFEVGCGVASAAP